jgi:hypothetical protein
MPLISLYYLDVYELHIFKNCKQLFEYQHLLLLRDIFGQCYKTFYGRKLRLFIIR